MISIIIGASLTFVTMVWWKSVFDAFKDLKEKRQNKEEE